MTILVTRPSPDGEKLVSKLLSVGRLAYHFPLISFSKGKNLSLLKQKLCSLSKGDFLFFVSRYAVKYAHYQLLGIGMSWPTQLIYYSVGRSTSLTIYTLSGILAKYPQDQETSEGLLRLPELMYINNMRRALILRGNTGRSLLQTTLQKRGVFVDFCECYFREFIQYNGVEECDRMLSLGIRVIVVTTEEMLRRLYYLIPNGYRIGWLVRCRLLVVSLRLANIAKNLGWVDIVVTCSADNDVILRYLLCLNFE